MSTDDTGSGAGPMDEETSPCNEIESSVNDANNDSSPSSMDWVKVDDDNDDTAGMEKSGETAAAANTAAEETSGLSPFSSLKAMCNKFADESSAEKITATTSTTHKKIKHNFDEYSFGSSSSDEDDDQEEANISLVDTSFDMQILQTSIEKSADALDLVRDKNVIMVVGKTGVGKSTLIQGIAGKQIHTLSHTSSFSGETATKTVYGAQDALEDFEIGHGKVSKTKSLSAYLREDVLSGKDYVYLDSPGLEDTRGVEMDIATSALLSQVAKRCKSLRFLILIHCASLIEDRGNAFRTIINFSKRFVPDFEESKYSFMFLFTHTDEIVGMSSSSSDTESKKRIQGEIVHIAEAVKDEDLSKVLSFVGKSLKKNYPFANILHPLDTDYEQLASAVEEKLQPLENLDSASICNLTFPSMMKLEVAVQNLLQRLQVIISSSPDDITPIKDIQKTFHYLNEYIGIPVVCKAAQECEAIVYDHQVALKRLIESECERWTSSSSDFAEGNATALKDALRRLELFDSTFSSENWVQTKTDALQALQEDIMKRATSFRSFDREIQKLQVWTHAFGDCSEYYTDLCKRIMTLFEDTMNDVSQTELSSIQEMQEKDLALFVDRYLILYTMGDFSKLTHIPDFEDASVRREKILNDTMVVFSSWAKKASDMAESNVVNFEDDLGDIVSYVRFLEMLKFVAEKHDIGANSLDKLINSSLRSLEDDVMSLFKSCCEDVKDSDFDPRSAIRLKLRWMQDTCDRFSSLQSNCGSELFSLYFAVVNKIKSSLLSTSGELETMSKFTQELGLRNGENLGKDVANFLEWQWFDAFLPEGEAFVANCCIAIERSIQQRIDTKSIELEECANCMGTGNSAESIASLGLLLPELKEIDCYLAILNKEGEHTTSTPEIREHTTSPTPNNTRSADNDDVICDTRSCSACGIRLPKTKFSKTQWFKGKKARCKTCVDSKNSTSHATVEDVEMEDAVNPSALIEVSQLAPKCVKYLQDYTSKLSVESSRRVAEWTDKVESRHVGSLFAIAQDLECIFVDAKALNTIYAIQSIVEESEMITTRIVTACKLLSDLVDSEMSQFGGDFLLKATILNLVAVCNSLPHIGQKVPVYSDVLVRVRALVACEAQRLEIEIEAISEWDKIDKQIELFKEALVLDEFVSGEATARTRVLNRLREKKEGQVDEHLQSMIAANNFKGIAEFLSPLAGSKDQIKKQRFEHYLDDITFNLDLTIKDVKRCMNQDTSPNRVKSLPSDEETIRVISQKMIILATAKDNLHRLIQSRIDLSSEVRKLETMISNGLSPLLKQFLEYIEKKDYVRAAASDSQVSVVTQHLGQYITTTMLKRKKAFCAQYERELNGVLDFVDDFFRSSFKSTNDLLRALTSLREAKESNDTSLERLASLYDEARQLLLDKVRDHIADVREIVTAAECFDEVIPMLHMLHREMNGPFKSHLTNDIVSECNNLLERLRQEKKEHDRLLDFGESDVKEKLEIWRKKLDKLQSPGVWRRFWYDDKTSYNKLKGDLNRRCKERLNQAYDALRSRDLHLVQDCISFLVLVQNELHAHVENGARLKQLQERCIKAFIDLCQQVGKALKKKDITKFEEKFMDYRGFLLNIRCISTSKECQNEFALVNQMLYESFVHHTDAFHALVKAETLDFSNIRSKVLQLRKMGAFMADRVTLLNEEMKYSMKDTGLDDKWLDRIRDLCSKHFSDGRDLGKLKCCVDLGVAPSATQKEINSAFRGKAKLYHPDKGGTAEMFRKITEAKDELLKSKRFKSSCRPQAFDEVLNGIGEHLRALSRQFMREQRYDMAESLIFQLPALKELDNLVEPKLKSEEVQTSVHEIIKGHVEKMRVEVDTAWSERRYKDLNNSITDLKAMESCFKSYPEIFPTSWNNGIVATIEAEILELGKKAKACLSSHAVAKKNEGDFKRYFLQMSSVLVELPSFKIFTRHEMSNILDSCLDKSWGYSFLFEFGLSMQKGDDSTSDDEKRIAQMTVAEFDHFKEVLTMCWNQETSQKPVEDVVMDITGANRLSSKSSEKMNIDRDELIDSFKLYDTQYKSLLGEYIKPGADLSDLVKKVKVLAKKLQPISCDKMWTIEEKKHIPSLLAGVFSLFTILKSGASFNRIEEAGGSSTFGEQLLMKPHNIQVLTLLYMFGCGKGQQSSLESQLMQIRTGEGKSMILGAAAAMLALLGFRVRTVCYSEYLSSRDFRLFEEVFQKIGVLDLVKYSKITTFAEDSTAAKGNIRDLTESLLRGDLSAEFGSVVGDATTVKSPQRRLRSHSPAKQTKKQKTSSSLISRAKASINGMLGYALDALKPSAIEEILLVDEVDVFFGAEFYGKTYNQVIEFKEPEVTTILKRIWDAHSKGGHRLRLNDVKAMSHYKRLLAKMASFDYLLDNEINLMLNQVKRVDDVPYFLDENDRIGYKVMDSISYNVTFGYATIFAYLKEADNLKNKEAALSRALVMPISCGQFSYANISPTRIMGVSGTLAAIGEYEKDVLSGYGLNKYIFVPSVYGESNFHFDKAGDGIYFESSKSNFYHKISAEIKAATKAKRAVIVFFRDRTTLNEFVGTATYRQLGRHKSLLTEDMRPREKDFIINKAATAGQITLSTAVFGRGTDFFCKDDSVEKNGGVHIIQVRSFEVAIF
eukprot:scaffold2497_cov117-Skeletonema_menzelii.AAC.6